jgi:hypothetical protein
MGIGAKKWIDTNLWGGERELPMTSEAQQALLEGVIMPRLQELLGEDFRDLLETDPTAGTQRALTELERMISSESPARQGFADAYEAIQGLLGRGPTDIEDFIQSSIVAPGERYLYEEALPQVRARAAALGGPFGGETIDAEQEAISRFLESIDSVRAQTALEARYRDAQVLLEAAGMAGQLPGAESNLLAGAGAALDMPRQIDMDSLLAALDQEFRLMQLGGQIGTASTIQTQYDPGDMRIFLSNTAQSAGQELGSMMGSAAKGGGGGMGGIMGGMT